MCIWNCFMNSSLSYLRCLLWNDLSSFWIWVSTDKFFSFFDRFKSLLHLLKIFDRCFILSFNGLCKLKAIFSFLKRIFLYFVWLSRNFIVLLFFLKRGVVLFIVKLAFLNDLKRLSKWLVMNWSICFRWILSLIIGPNGIFIKNVQSLIRCFGFWCKIEFKRLMHEYFSTGLSREGSISD